MIHRPTRFESVTGRWIAPEYKEAFVPDDQYNLQGRNMTDVPDALLTAQSEKWNEDNRGKLSDPAKGPAPEDAK